MKDIRDLNVWNRAHSLTLEVYKVTAKYPSEERYSLVSQTRRAAASIPANIAEGCGRGSDADFGRFLQIAMGSACELEYHLLLARDLKIIEISVCAKLDADLAETKKMLVSLLRKLKADR